jgi:putative transposase
MDGKRRALDNVWIESFWKIIKYNHIYLNPVDDVLELWKGISRYIRYYNSKIHQTTKDTPVQRYVASVKSAA